MEGDNIFMSTTIDKRLVEMGFDNQQFERNVKTSIDSLGNLKKGLQLDNSAKSLKNLSDTAKAFSLGNISDGVQNISNKFSAFGAIGFTVLQNLTNSAIQFGQTIITNIMNPMKMGFAEYETQMNAIQTTLANTESKGTTLKDVNAALALLNEYADKTIYNFSEMTKNIGTFTAAGIDLDTSVAAIKGIANLAAVSGSNSQQASTAMYQLSQALSSGTVKLQDWNSVVNAGMGGQVFQDALKETARLHEVKIDEMIKREGSFRNTLQEGWLTSEILTETLAKFTGDLTASQLETMGYTEDQIAAIIKLGQTANDAATKVKTLTQLQDTIKESMQSGWAQSWQIIIGDFEEAKVFFTEVSDTLGGLIGASSDARNKILYDWKKFGGRVIAIEAIRNSFQALLSIGSAISEAFKSIFPPVTGHQLRLLTGLIRDFTAKLILSGGTLDKVKSIFRGFFAAIDIGRMFVVSLIKTLYNLINPLVGPAAGKALAFLLRIASYLINLRNTIKDGDLFGDAFKKIIGNIGLAIVVLKTFVEGIVQTFNTIKTIITSSNAFAIISEKIKIFITNLISHFKSIKKINLSDFMAFIAGIREKFNDLSNGIKTAVDRIGEILGGLSERIKARFEPLNDLRKDIVDKLDRILSGIIEGLNKALEKKIDSVSGIGEFIGNIFQGIKDALSKLDFGTFDFDKTFDSINKALTGGLILTLIGYLKKGPAAFDGVTGLVSSAKDFVDTAKGAVGSFSGMLTEVNGTLQAMQQSLRADILTKIAIAIAILAASILVLSLIDSQKLTLSLIAITALFTDLFAAMAIYEKTSGAKGAMKMVGAVMGMVGVAVAMLILSVTLKKISDLKPDQLKIGVIALLAILGEIVIFLRGINNVNLNPGIGLAMVGIAVAILLITKSIATLGEMKPDVLKQGLLTIAAILAEIGLFTKLTGNTTSLVASALGLIILGGALFIIIEAITKMGNLDVGVITKGLATMGGALGIIGIAMRLFPKDMLVKAIGLTVVAASLLILSKSLISLGNMSWDEIARGLVVLGGAMLIIVIAMKAMQTAIAGAVALLIVSAALSLLTVVLKTLGAMNIAQIGIALLAIAGIFIVLGIAGYLLGPVVPILFALGAAMLLMGLAALAFGAGVMILASGLALLAVSGIAGATALVAMIGILLGIIPIVVAAIVGGIILFAKLIAEGAPVIGEALKALILMVLDVINEVFPEIMSTLDMLLKGLLKLFVDNVPNFVQSGMDIIIGILTGIRDNIFEIVTVAIEIVTEFIDAVAAKLPDIIDSGFGLIVSFIDGLAASIEENGQDLADAVGRLAKAIVTGLCDGLTAGVGGVKDAIMKLGGTAIETLKSLLGIFSPSRVFTKLGRLTGTGFVNGIVGMVVAVKDATKNLGNTAVTGITGVINNIADAISTDLNMSPTIRPVVDLTDVVTGGKQIDNLFNNKKLDLSSSLLNASSVAASASNVSNQNGSASKQSNPASITLTQINNSPKALDRLEIYRQTRNQLQTLKGLVKA